MLNFCNPVENYPYPHIVQDNILPKDLYNSLKETLPSIDSFGQAFRMHGDLTHGDQIYDELLNLHPAWKNLHDYIYSKQFVNSIINKFRPNIISSIESGELNLDLQNVKYDPFMEGRKIKKNVKEFPLWDKFVSKPSDLYTRLDIGYGLESYGKIGGGGGIHIDNSSRLFSMLIYFCDQSDFNGGEFVIYETFPDNTLAPKSIIPLANNRAIISLQSNSAFHSVNEVISCNAPRYALYLAIASRKRLWKRISNSHMAKLSKNRRK